MVDIEYLLSDTVSAKVDILYLMVDIEC
jgi:hypothetical protein